MLATKTIHIALIMFIIKQVLIDLLSPMIFSIQSIIPHVDVAGGERFRNKFMKIFKQRGVLIILICLCQINSFIKVS